MNKKVLSWLVTPLRAEGRGHGAWRMTPGSLRFALCALLFALSMNCGGGEQSSDVAESGSGSAAGGDAVWQPTGNEGSITGSITFQGIAPTFKAIGMTQDAACASKHSGPVYPEEIVVNDNGTLRDVFVYVKIEKSGLDGKKFTVPSEPVTLDQDGCIYKPHVLGIQSNQTLRITSQDDTTHNVHPMPKVNREWNESQPPNVTLTKTFTREEVLIPVKCNQHPWMKAYIGVLSHPFFAVSGEDGTYTIKGLPPGDYEIEAYHDRYGAQPMKVSVPANGTATVDFTFDAQQTYQPGSLKMMPALVLP